MKYTDLKQIERLINAFEKATLPRYKWNHQAHLIVAAWYLTHAAKPEAINLIRNGIKKYNAAVGIITTPKSGYHETITLFWIKIVEQYLTSISSNFAFIDIANSLLENTGDSHLIWQYYTTDILMSAQARNDWVEPNLKPITTPKLLTVVS